MGTYVVKQGECFATVASTNGTDADALYRLPDNADLRKKRPNPNILHPGDPVVVPDPPKKFVGVVTEKRHRFQVKLPRRELRLTLLDPDGKPIAGERFILEAGAVRIVERTTADGAIKQSIPGRTQTATLTIRGRSLLLQCSCLDPLTDAPDEGVSGARERLRNLGYDVGDASDELDPLTRTALALFQHEAKVEVTGDLDDATVAELLDRHGC